MVMLSAYSNSCFLYVIVSSLSTARSPLSTARGIPNEKPVNFRGPLSAARGNRVPR